MKRKKVIAVVVVLTLMLASIPFVVSAASPAFNMASRMGNGIMNGQMGQMGEMDDEMQQTLGLSKEQMQELRQQGKSIADIAKQQGVSMDVLINKMTAEQTERINDMVDKGIISADQKDAMLAQMKERMLSNLNRTEVGPPAWAGKQRQGNMRMNEDGMQRGMGAGFGMNR